MIEKLKKILIQAITEAYDKDASLFSRSRMERACVFRIGYYLQCLINEEEKLKSFNLDCEYNKNGAEPKKTLRRPNGTQPDLIIHKRLPDKGNLLVVEFKLGEETAIDEDDRIKLEDFTSPECGYNYLLGAFVRLGNKTAQYKYFRGGELVDE